MLVSQHATVLQWAAGQSEQMAHGAESSCVLIHNLLITTSIGTPGWGSNPQALPQHLAPNLNSDSLIVKNTMQKCTKIYPQKGENEKIS
jgi:hypothetical protein